MGAVPCMAIDANGKLCRAFQDVFDCLYMGGKYIFIEVHLVSHGTAQEETVDDTDGSQLRSRDEMLSAAPLIQPT